MYLISRPLSDYVIVFVVVVVVGGGGGGGGGSNGGCRPRGYIPTVHPSVRPQNTVLLSRDIHCCTAASTVKIKNIYLPVNYIRSRQAVSFPLDKLDRFFFSRVGRRTRTILDPLHVSVYFILLLLLLILYQMYFHHTQCTCA